MMRYLLLLLIPFFLNAAEEHVLYVKAKKDLTTLYLSQFIIKQTPLESSYLKRIYDAIYTDLASNGFSEIKTTRESIEKLLKTDPGKIASDLPARHTLRMELNGQTLSVVCYSASMLMGQNAPNLQLTGKLTTDIKRVHHLCDNLSEMMYGQKGIASCPIFYSQIDEQKPKESEIWMKNFDGLSGEMVTSERALCMFPISIAETDKIIYTSYKSGQPKIYLSHLYANNSRPLVHLAGNQFLPAISQRGDLLAFISDAAGRPSDLFMVQLKTDHTVQGKPIQLYSHPTADNSSPSFSPDGGQIAFVSEDKGSTHIYILNVAETLKSHKTPKVSPITKKNRINVSPSWSMDGKKIAYSAKTDGIYQIWMYDCETKEEYQLTDGPEDKENPSWAPNNLHIVYNTTSPSFELFVINLNQLKPIQITHGPGIKHFPYWDKTTKRRA